LKIKLRTWLVICLFGISAVFSIAIFVVVYRSLEDNLLERTKDRLNSINILKTRLVEQVLANRRTEIFRILAYQKTHISSQEDLIDALSSIQDVQQIGVISCADCNDQFSAATIPDSSYYQFEYGIDTVFVRVYLDYDVLKDILKERTGMGATGESYMVGPNYRMMSESIFFPDSLPRLIPCKTIGAIRAFQGQTGVEVYPDYRDVPIIGVYRLVDYFGINMALLTEIDVEEAMSPIKDIRARMIELLLVILLFSLLGSTLLAEWLQRPVRRLKAIADKLTLGELPENSQHPEFIVEFSAIMQSMNKLVEALRSTVQFANYIGKGKMNETYVSLGEKDELGKAIMSMRDQLIILDKEKTRLERQSKKILLEGQEKERARIARDLHDGLGAMLTTMKLRLGHELNETTKEELTALLDDAISEARNLSRNLMPAVLMDFGLFDALAQLAQSTQKNAGITVNYIFESEHQKSRLKKSRQVYVYRIAQEAINNALKHADCTEIQLSITEFDDQLNVYIKDNGKGLADGSVSESQGLGFKNIKERTELLNGELILESDNRGTIVEVNIPIE
jgi:two-component system NarL family sensor kinase